MRRLIALVYRELQHLAHHHRYRWDGEPTPGTTSLVHEAYTRIVSQPEPRYASRGEFFKLASRAMRSVLVDSARYHQRRKRGGGVVHVPAEDSLLVSEQRFDELLALDRALDRLEREHPRLVQVTECRCFAGLSVEETAQALNVSTATVKRDWNVARAMLYRDMGTDE
jgi:RNA polymerase sigma factor (TIGR02999 family)